MIERPGGALAKRPLQFIWIIDRSGSMHGTKMEALNYAMKECIKRCRTWPMKIRTRKFWCVF